jgi:flagellar hook-associated protein 1
MLGLFGLLNLGARSLTTEQEGVSVAGHNLANVNNPNYSRQRLSIVTSPSIAGDLGPQGTGAEGAAIVRLRNNILDGEIQGELSVSSSLDAQQTALQLAESSLGQRLDSTASSAAGEVGTSHSVADGLTGLFNSFQSLSTDPSSSAQRQTVLGKASELATQFNQIDQRLGELNESLNANVQDDTESANTILEQVANLNDQIRRAEIGNPGSANDLRDTRQAVLEQLAKLVKIDTADGDNGTINVSLSGTMMVTGNEVTDTLEAYDPGDGQMQLRAKSGAALTLTGGRIQGTIDARDGVIAGLRNDLNTLAATLLQEVNSVHGAGYNLKGGTGTDFFTGTGAGDIHVNAALLDDPSLVQAASAAGAVGDNGVALALAQLGQKPQTALNQQTFVQSYSRTASAFGQAVSTINTQISDQKTVENMLLQQRTSMSGVSLDEELTDLTRFQRAFQASARLISTIDSMLETVVNLKQ